MATAEVQPEGSAALDEVVRLLLAERYRVVPRRPPGGAGRCPSCGSASIDTATVQGKQPAARQ